MATTGTTDELHVGDDDLERIWEDKPGLLGFLSTIDHKRIGMRYIYTAFVFFFAGGLIALAMRAQLTAPNGHVVGPEAYNGLFTMHGTMMIFLFNTPVLAGFGNYLLPLMLGTRGPDLTDFGSRRWLGAITVPNTSNFLEAWITSPGNIKPGVLMPPTPLPPDQLRALVAYLESLK